MLILEIQTKNIFILTGKRCYPDPTDPLHSIITEERCMEKFYAPGVCKCLPPCKEETISTHVFDLTTIPQTTFRGKSDTT